MVAPAAMVALKVVLLHCDRTAMYGGRTQQMFRDLLVMPHNEQPVQLFDFNVQALEYPETWDDVDAVVITGSTASVNDGDDWILRLIAEIRNLVAMASEQGIRILGVCFGHQLLAHALGGRVTAHTDGLFFGARRFLMSAHAQQGMAWGPSHMTLMNSHCDVVSRLPEGARPFGCSERCGVEGMVLGTHILSLQGHPEFAAGTSGLQSVRDLASHFVSKGMLSSTLASKAVSMAEAGLYDAGPLQRALVSFLRKGLEHGPLFGGAGTQPVIGFGSLLSERSARSSFPSLTNFRLARLQGFRRIMRHPASIFFQRGIANLHTAEMASLCVEPIPAGRAAGDEVQGSGFLVAAFEIPAQELPEFFEREEEFFIVTAPIHEMDGSEGESPRQRGLLCCASTDAEYVSRRGEEAMAQGYARFGLASIWHWHGPILPCRVYLRHCLLATQKAGQHVHDDFVDTTFLADGHTTIREHLDANPGLMEDLPPPHLADRYSG